MRHRFDKRKLNRDCGARKAMLRNLVSSLFEYNKIVTTEARAKETRRIAESLITTAKQDTVHARRMVVRVVTKKETVKKLFKEIAPAYTDRPGGYTRIVKLGPRKGDCAFMAVIELIGLSEKPPKQEPETKEN